MSKIEHSLDIEVPVREAYNQWTQFEEFPRFMEGVESVRQLDDTRLHWVATVAGQRKEWDAKITEQTPDQRVAWTSTSGSPNAGAVNFHRISDTRTRVTLTMDVEPEGVVENVGDALGVPSGQVKGDLERFKEFIENRGRATGGWRGEVDQSDVSGDQSDVSGSDRTRDLAGAGAMGATGTGADLGSDYGTPASGGLSGSGTGTGYGSDYAGTDIDPDPDLDPERRQRGNREF